MCAARPSTAQRAVLRCAALRPMPQYALQALAHTTTAAASGTMHTVGGLGGVTALHVQAKHAEWNELFAKCATRSVQTHPHAHTQSRAQTCTHTHNHAQAHICRHT